MEIDKAIRESDDARLKAKYNDSIFVIQRAFSLYSIEEVAFSFNGGKDSTVLLHLLRASYFLNQSKQCHSDGDLTDGELRFPIRTIYFESPSAFPEINSFTHETALAYHLQLDTIHVVFKSGLEALLKEKPIKAIFLGVRMGDPSAVGQEKFSPSSPGWPAFMRVNPILDWAYSDVWAFLLTCKVKYCSLYDQGYTSIGSIHDTVPNSLLCINDDKRKENFRPAYLLSDGRLERAGRTKKVSRPLCGTLNNGLKILDMRENSMLTASVIAVGDEILFGTVEDQLGPVLCRKLSSIGWAVSRIAVVQNDIDSVAEEVARFKSANDMVFIHGGVGPLHSDVTVAGVAKAFGVRMASNGEFEEYLKHLVNGKCAITSTITPNPLRLSRHQPQLRPRTLPAPTRTEPRHLLRVFCSRETESVEGGGGGGTGADVEWVVRPDPVEPTRPEPDWELVGLAGLLWEWGLLISPFFFWGTAMVAMKEVLPKTGPFFVAAFRLVPAGLLLVGFAGSRGRKIPSGLPAWVSISLFGLVDAACFQGFLAEGLQRTTAGLGSVIIDSQPLTVAVLATLLFGESIGFVGASGLVLGVIGLLLLELPALSFGNANSLWGSGEWWMLLAAQSMAVGTVMVRWVSKYSDPIMATGWHMVIGGLPLVAISILNHDPVIDGGFTQLTLNDLLALLYTSIFGSAASYGVYFYNATRGSLTKLSSLTFLTPMFASIFGFFYLGETFSPVQLIGAFVTVAAIYMVNYKSSSE